MWNPVEGFALDEVCTGRFFARTAKLRGKGRSWRAVARAMGARLPDPPAAESNLRLKRRAHGPLTGIVLIEIAGCDVVVHAGADIPRRHLNLESAMESLRGRRFVAGLLLEELDRDRIGVGQSRRVIHQIQHGVSHLSLIGFASSPSTARQAEHQRGTQGTISET